MAAEKITALTNLTTPQPTMLLYSGLSPFGVTDDRKVTANNLFAEITANVSDVSIQWGNGVAAAVSAASKGKIIYNATAQAFQVSENGGAYTSLLKGSGTSQQVGFFTAASTIGGDTAFVWDSTNNRLGVNVTVAASTTSLNVRADGSAIAAEFLPNTVSDNPRVQIQVTSSDGRIGTSNATPSPFYIITNNTERISIESGGAVAINRTSPAQAQLHVDAATNVTSAFLANNASGSSVDIGIFQVNGSNRLRITQTGEIVSGLASTQDGKLTLASSGAAFTQSLQAGTAPSATNTFRWPNADPTAGQILSASAPVAGVVTLSWVANGGGGTSPGGSNTQVQFNNAGTFDGSANLTWVSPVLTVGASASATGRLTLAHASGSTTTSFEPTNAAASLIYQLPSVSPTAGQFLQAAAPSGANVALSWATAVTGSGTATRAAFWSGTNTLSSDAAFYWDNTNKRLGIGTTSPETSLDVVADGSAIAQQWRENGAGTCRVQMQIPSSFGQLGTSSNHSFALITNGAQRLNVESTGAVVVGNITAATATLLSNAIATGDIALIANNASGTTVDIARFQVNSSNRFRFLNTGEAILGLASTVTGKLTLSNASGTTLTSISAGNAASTLNFIWPVVDPTSGQVLSASAPSGGNVTLSWVANGSGGGSPGGSNTQVQFNNAGTFDGSANLTWVSPVLTVGASASATGRLTLAHASGSTTTSFEPTNAAASLIYQLPSVSPTAGQFLQAAAPSGANVALSWATAVTGSGTATRAAFWSGTNTLSSDAAFYWDNTNKRLGIGTASPETSLDVIADGSAIAQQWRENGAGTCRVQMQIPSSFGQLGTSSNHSFALITNGAQRLNVESTGAVVVGNITAATATLLSNAIATGDIALIANNASGTTVDIARFQVNSSNRFRFLNTGEAIFGLASTATGKLTLSNASGTTLTSISAGNAASTLNFIWPVVDPTAGQVLSASAPSGGNVTLSWVANGSGAPPTLTATQIGFGDGSNQLSGSTRLTWDDTNRAMTLGESANSGQVTITLRSTNTSSALITGSAASRPGSQGGVIFPNVGGDQTQGPGLTWSDGNYNATSRLYISLGLNWQGYDTGGQSLNLRKSTATSSQGATVFEFRPNDGYAQLNPFNTSAGNTTEIRFLELAANGFNYVALKAPDAIGSTNPVIVLPSSSAPSTNDVLTVTGVSSGIITTAWQAGGGGGITGSGTAGKLAKFTGATAVGDSIITESTSLITIAGRQTINGLTINTDATNTVASLTANSTFTKNDNNSRTFYGVLVQPTFNFGGSNLNTTVNLLAVDSTNTAVTGTIFNLLNLAYGGTTKFSVDSNGAITFANGVRQAFAPSATTPSLNVGTVSGDPSSPVNGDIWYDSTNNLLRAQINSATVSLGAGGGGSPGGSSGDVQYNNAGSFGGTNLAFASSVLTQTRTSLGGTTVTDSLVLRNSTAAAAGAQQISPALALEGQGWKTNASAASQSVKWGMAVLPVQGAANPTGELGFYSNVNAGGYTRRAYVDTSGTFWATQFAFPSTNNNIAATDGLTITFTTNSVPRVSVSSNDIKILGTGGQVIFNNGGSGLAQAAANVVGFTNASTAGGTFAAVATSPSQITADQNNYNPGGSSYFQRWSTDASRQITGMTFTATQVAGQSHQIWNVGAQDIVLVHESASSTAANRFVNSSAANYTLTPGQGAQLIYDATSSRWRVCLLQ